MSAWLKITFFLSCLSLGLNHASAATHKCSPLITSNRHGEFLSVWVVSQDEQVSLQSTVFTPEWGFSDSLMISQAERNVASLPLSNLNALGQGIVIWESHDPATEKIHLEAAGYTNEKGWSTPRILSEAAEEVEPSSCKLHLSDDGYFLLFWNSISCEAEESVRKNIVLSIEELY